MKDPRIALYWGEGVVRGITVSNVMTYCIAIIIKTQINGTDGESRNRFTQICLITVQQNNKATK